MLAVHDDRLVKVVREHRPNLYAEYMLQLSTAYNSFYETVILSMKAM